MSVHRKRLSTRERWIVIALTALAMVAGMSTALALRPTPDVTPEGKDSGRPSPWQSTMLSQLPRPPVAHRGPLNILLLGSDSRDERSSVDEPTGWRTDTMILMHIPAKQDRAFLVSLPRDLWVDIPGHGMGKINSAYALGGRPLTKRTVERYTGVKLHYTGIVDFWGLKRVVDKLGGIDMTVEKTITSIHPPYRAFRAGKRHFNGAEALDYIRQRKQFADGDFARMSNQQQFVKAVMTKAVKGGLTDRLSRLDAYLTAARGAFIWDRKFRTLDLMWQFRKIRAEDMSFRISPNTGGATVDGQSVILPDEAGATKLYNQIAKDTL